ncbi:MAG TPA: acyl-CoA reductase [Elusimicrobiota bacterium]|nr:acyl-CoA reductase [Elusimicrobiota bacterium]
MKSSAPHFWLGEWIGDAELEKRVAALDALVLPSEPAPTDAVLDACERTARQLSNKNSALRKRLENALLESGAASKADMAPAFAEIAGMLVRPALETKLKRELGSKRPFLLGRVSYDEDVFEAWAPLGLLVHVAPQNSFATGALSVVEGLLSGNVNFLKTGGTEPPFAQLFLEGLARNDRSGVLKNYLIAARISSKRADLLSKVFAAADAIAAWGGEDAVASIRKMAPAGARLIEWGHRISFIYLAEPFAAQAETLERVAHECCHQEQLSCSSPQCVYVDTDNWETLERFAKDFAKTLAKVSKKISRLPPDDAAAAEINMVTQCQELESCLGQARVIAAQDGSWRVLADARPALAPSPLYRTIWVKPLPRQKIIQVLRPMKAYLQTAGLACGVAEVHELTRLLISGGAARVRRIGEMTGSYSGEPHDGLYALQRYCRRVSVQVPFDGRGISAFDELSSYPPLAWPAPPPVTPKEAFSSENPEARLFFKSGGSTGKPKLSTFTYDQYDDDMSFGAQGLYAAGLDPEKDRAMNLFFCGGLYGGFISIFSALERLRVAQFPMAAHQDLKMVARAVVDYKVNVLLGMPSYLMNLFEQNAGLLEKYRGVTKIFYGGEHFTEAQRRYLKTRFGVDLIRSGAYGSVDIGPMGFQCEHCADGVHHLQQKLHFLEILKLDEDRPVSGEDVGRLVFSPREPGSSKPKRYAIGDVGHWILTKPGEPCPCGRLSPRFKLLGRVGDVFRVGSFFLNYQKFAQILSTHADYAGELQICLQEDGRKEKILLRVSKGAGASAAQCAAACLKHYGDLAQAVTGDKTLLFSAQEARAGDFERSAASGKLLRVVDKRKR